jgi:hypothetical protein
MKSTSLKAARSQSISKMVALRCVVETANRSEDDKDCYWYNLSSTRSSESATSRTASLTDDDESTWETHSTNSSFTSAFQETTADVTRESQLQVQFAEQTAEEMAQVMSYWSNYDSDKTPKTQLSDSDYQRTCLPTNSLIINEEEEVGETSSWTDTESRMNNAPSLIYATPRSVMSQMSAMTPRTPEPAMAPQHFSFMGADSTPVPCSPMIPEDPFSPMMTKLSAEELHWIAREQKSRVDEICWATQAMAEALAELTDTSDGDDHNHDGDDDGLFTVAYSDFQKLPLLSSLPVLTWRDHFAVPLKGPNAQLLGDFLFLCVLHMLPLEYLSVYMWLRLNTTNVRRRFLLACWLACALLAASFLALERLTKYSFPTALVCFVPSPCQHHAYPIDDFTHLYSTLFLPEHEQAFLL